MLRYAITDRTRFSGDEPARQVELLRQAWHWAADGLDFVQLREKDLAAGALADLARILLAVLRTGESALKLIISSRADVAVAVSADGVHLTSAPGELTPGQVRALFAAAGLPRPVVSVSCHTLDEVVRNCEAGADLILFGPVFEKVVFEKDQKKDQKKNQPVAGGSGLDLLRTACAAAAPTPVLALGGVTPGNRAACIEAGAAGIAAIRLFTR